MNPLVSFCVPTRNRAFRLSACLKTFLASCKQNFECVIIDNASTDNTAEVVEPYLLDSRFRYVRFNERGSINTQFSRCVENSLGEWITIIGDDDGILGEYFDGLVSLLTENSGVLETIHAISWPQVIYRWPDFPGPEANMLRISPCTPQGSVTKLDDSRLFFDFSDNNLKKIYTAPQIYHSLVRLNTARKIVSAHPKTAFLLSPDISFACHFALSALPSLRLPFPVTIAGYSSSSTGGSFFNGLDKVRDQFFVENEGDMHIYQRVFGMDFSINAGSSPSTEVSIIYSIACMVADSHGVEWPSVESYLVSEVNNARKVSPRIRPLVRDFLSAFARSKGFNVNLEAFDSRQPSLSLGGPRIDIHNSGGARMFSCTIKIDTELVRDIFEATKFVRSLIKSFN